MQKYFFEIVCSFWMNLARWCCSLSSSYLQSFRSLHPLNAVSVPNQLGYSVVIFGFESPIRWSLDNSWHKLSANIYKRRRKISFSILFTSEFERYQNLVLLNLLWNNLISALDKIGVPFDEFDKLNWLLILFKLNLKFENQNHGKTLT